MSEKYRFWEKNIPYFCTFSLVGWAKLFSSDKFAMLLMDSLDYCIEYKQLEIFSYCIMPSHMHLIARSQTIHLGDIVRDFKKYTANAIIHLLESEAEGVAYLRTFQKAAFHSKRNKYYKVWQDGSHPIQLDTEKIFLEKLHYIHYNPVAEGLVLYPEQYTYSSAGDYMGKPGKIRVVLDHSR